MRMIHKLMISFVDICSLSIRLRESGKWHKFKGAMKKVLLDDDSGVKGAVDGFKKLIENQSSIRDTITLEQVLRSRQDLAKVLKLACETKRSIADVAKGVELVAKGVDVLTGAESNRKLEQIKQENQQTIIKKLLGSYDAVKASKDLWDKQWRTSFRNSGSWLPEIAAYSLWIDQDSNTTPLLLLTGEPNCGKSFISSVIVSQLQSIAGERSDGLARKIIVAYYFLPQANWENK
jgi:hypothetical protein